MNSACRVLPNMAGERSTITPAASRAVILESAPPRPPETMAPDGFVSRTSLNIDSVEHTSVSHSASWWSRDTSDEADNWLASSVVLLQEIGSLFLSRSSDLSNHDNTIGLTILEEDSQAVDKVGSGEWVTANADDERLTETALRGLVNGFVGKGSGARDDANAAAFVDESWHDTDLALAWGDDTWAVRADEAGPVLGLQDVGDADHVVLWDTLGNTRAMLEAV